MQGKSVQVQLHTPILVPTAEGAKVSEKQETVLLIKGNVSQFSEAGLVLEIKELWNQKNEKISSPYKSIFLPHHKIDHVAL